MLNERASLVDQRQANFDEQNFGQGENEQVIVIDADMLGPDRNPLPAAQLVLVDNEPIEIPLEHAQATSVQVTNDHHHPDIENISMINREPNDDAYGLGGRGEMTPNSLNKTNNGFDNV